MAEDAEEIRLINVLIMETNENTQTKKCSKCGRELPLSEFSRNHSTKDGYDYYCRSCKSTMYKESRERTKANKAKKSGIFPANFFDKNLTGGVIRSLLISPKTSAP